MCQEQQKKRQISEGFSSLDNKKELKRIVQDFTLVQRALQKDLEAAVIVCHSFDPFSFVS